MSSEQPGFGGRPDYGSPHYGPAANQPPQYAAPQQQSPQYAAPQYGAQPGQYPPQGQPVPGWNGGPATQRQSFPAPQVAVVPRPVSVTMSSVLTVTAGLQALGVVAMIWLFIAAGAGSLDATDEVEGPIFHILERANLALTNGLAAPLLGFPAAGFVVGFLVLIRANWSRILSTALGLGAAGWMIVWRLNQLNLVAVPILYIAISVLLLWLPGNNRWYRGQSRSTP